MFISHMLDQHPLHRPEVAAVRIVHVPAPALVPVPALVVEEPDVLQRISIILI